MEVQRLIQNKYEKTLLKIKKETEKKKIGIAIGLTGRGQSFVLNLRTLPKQQDTTVHLGSPEQISFAPSPQVTLCPQTSQKKQRRDEIK